MGDAQILEELKVASQLGHFKYQDGKLSGMLLPDLLPSLVSSHG